MKGPYVCVPPTLDLLVDVSIMCVVVYAGRVGLGIVWLVSAVVSTICAVGVSSIIEKERTIKDVMDGKFKVAA